MANEGKKVALLTWEVEGKKETYIVAHDPIVAGIEYDRFEFAQNAANHTAQIQSILAMQGQYCLVPKAQWDADEKERSMGIYPWNRVRGGAR